MAVLQPGQKLGPYRLGERISRGGMGEVWRALKTGEGGWSKAVALKLILPTLDEERFAAMFLAEARIAAALDHANIVPVFGFGREGDLLYIEMEQVVGQDLRHIVERARGQVPALPVPLALFVVGEALKGLSYAHERGVVHRDVKPHNTLCSYEGHVKLTDFGIAKLAAETGAGASRSEVKGTAGYIAPEVLEGAPASVRSDLFALGLLLWECLTGKKLFDGASEAERLRRTFDCRVPPVRRIVPEASAEVEELLVRLLAREPSARYGSAREALAVLLAAPGGRAASSEEMKAFLARHFATEAAAAAAVASAASASLRAAGVGVSASPADGVPREIIDDGPLVRSAPGRTPTLAGEEKRAEGFAVPGANDASAVATRAASAARPRRMWMLGALAVAAIVSVGAAVAWRPDGGGVRAQTPSPAPVPAKPTVPAPAPVEGASVVIEVTPHDVQLVVDGRAVPGSSPFALAEVPRGRTLDVRIVRDGYAPFERTLAVDAPVVRLPVVLTPVATPVPVVSPAPPAPAPVAKGHHGSKSRKPDRAPDPRHDSLPAGSKTPADDDGTMVPPPP